MAPVLRTARDAAELLGPRLADMPIETLLVAWLDEARRLLGIIEAEEGDVARADLAARQMLALAIRLGGHRAGPRP